MHPLAPDLTGLSDDELHKKRGELQNRLVFAYRMGQSDMIGQLQLLIDDYNIEVQKRNQKMLEQTNKNGSSFADKIDIGR